MLNSLRSHLIQRADLFTARLATTLRRRAEAAERRIHYTRRIAQRFNDLARLIESSNLSPADKRAAIRAIHTTARAALRQVRTLSHFAPSNPTMLPPSIPAHDSPPCSVFAPIRPVIIR